MIIGITGKKQHGKDTLARMLIENKVTSRQYARIGFADPLRKIGEVLGFTNQQMQLDKNKIHPLWARSWRKAAQMIGTDLFREQFDIEVWTKLAYQTICSHPNISFVFTDVRYDNEAEFIKKQGGIVFKIVRSDMPDKDNHKSEHGIDDKYVEEIICNFGTLNQLEKQVKYLAKKYEI